jgi:signal transduction histidine kinase
MARLLDDLLDISRLTRNRLELRRESVDLSQVIQRAVEISQPVIDSREHRLTMTPPYVSVPIVGDPVRLSQMLSNILINAAKYTPSGGHIDLCVERKGDIVSVRIGDDGIGILQESLPHIFDMFSQASRAGVEKDGLGLGLFIAKSIAELHGGSITASSPGQDKGSVFVIDLPALESNEKPAEPFDNSRSRSIKG